MNIYRNTSWKTSGEHDYVYMSVLPQDHEVRKYLEARVDTCLRDLITTRLKQRAQSPARPMVTEGEGPPFEPQCSLQ
jgi:ClpP class serine protease